MLKVLHIKLSATYFTRDNLQQLDGGVSVDHSNQSIKCHRVCYSTHSSLTELESFIRHFAPRKVIPCVLPDRRKRPEDHDKFQETFRDFLRRCGVAREDQEVGGEATDDNQDNETELGRVEHQKVGEEAPEDSDITRTENVELRLSPESVIVEDVVKSSAEVPLETPDSNSGKTELWTLFVDSTIASCKRRDRGRS